MIFGVGPSGVYLTNPLQNVPEQILSEQLSSPSELLVRRNDVIVRASQCDGGYVDAECDLSLLSRHADERWDQLNVLGQVVNVLREEQAMRRGPPAPAPGKATQTSHVKIPAIYQSGISLFVPVCFHLHIFCKFGVCLFRAFTTICTVIVQSQYANLDRFVVKLTKNGLG